MNESKIDVRKALMVFQRILDDGQRVDDNYVLNGLKANSGYDGYTVSIFNDFVRLDIQFHNKFTFNYSSEKERQAFMEKFEVLAKKDAR